VGIRVFAFATILAGLLLVAAAPGAMAAGEEDAQGIVDKSRVTLGELMRDDNYKWMKDHLKDAKGVADLPAGAQGGIHLRRFGRNRSVLLSRMANGGVEQPRFYTMGSVSFGCRSGGESAEVVLLVMTQKAMDSLLTSKFKAGWGRSVALGPVGGGAKSDVTADFLSFAKSKGLYAGLNLDGSYIRRAGKPEQSLLWPGGNPRGYHRQAFGRQKGADPLREELRRRNRSGTLFPITAGRGHRCAGGPFFPE